MTRISWDNYFFKLAEEVSKRSTCLRRQYGCVLVRDKTIISTGYNGAPRGCRHCEEIGCAREKLKSGERPELCRAAHAEQNAVANAARTGVSTLHSELYIEHLPCPICTKILINAGVCKVLCKELEGYPGWQMSKVLFQEASVKILVRREED